MKRFLIAGVALITVLALTGCGATGYTTGRAQKKAGEAAQTVIEDSTGLKAEDVLTYATSGAITGQTAQSQGIYIDRLLGSSYPNTMFDQIAVAVSIAKNNTFASLAVYLIYSGEADGHVITFKSVGVVTNSQTGFQFEAKECDEAGNIMNSGVSISVFGANFGTNVMLTTIFTNSTPLQLLQIN